MSKNPSTQFTNFPTTDDLNATIAVGETISNPLDLSATFLVGMIVPANFDGTLLQFKGSRDGEAFYPINNAAGTRLQATLVPGEAIALTPSDFAMWRFLQLVSVTAQATTPTVIGLVTRPLS